MIWLQKSSLLTLLYPLKFCGVFAPEGRARKNNVLEQSAHLFTSSFANQNAQKTIEHREKKYFDQSQKRVRIEGPLAVKENNSHKKLVLHAIIPFYEDIFACLGRKSTVLKHCRFASHNISLNRRCLAI